MTLTYLRWDSGQQERELQLFTSNQPASSNGLAISSLLSISDRKCESRHWASQMKKAPKGAFSTILFR